MLLPPGPFSRWNLTTPLALAVLALALALPASAAPIYGTDASGELTGTRDSEDGTNPLSSVGGLTGFGSWAGDGSDEIHFQVDWEIDYDTTTPGLWHYKYTFSDYEKSLSHVVLDLSDDCPVENVEVGEGEFIQTSECVQNVEIAGESWSILQFGDLDGILGAVKFDDLEDNEGSLVIEFDSNRAPVYGHLAVKDGDGPESCQDAYDAIFNGGDPVTNTIVCNNGLLSNVDTMNVLDYVARPNGVIPEPGTVGLVGLGLMGLGVLGRRRR